MKHVSDAPGSLSGSIDHRTLRTGGGLLLAIAISALFWSWVAWFVLS